MAHTPGTWRTLLSPHNKDIAILTNQGLIAEVFHRIDDNAYADAEANARLIAAAPALVTALKAFKRWQLVGDVYLSEVTQLVNQALAQAGE